MATTARINFSLPTQAVNIIRSGTSPSSDLTVLVEYSTDGGATWNPAPDGTVVNYSEASANASFVGGIHTATTSGGIGQAAVQTIDSIPDIETVHATSSVTISGSTGTCATGDGLNGDGPDAIVTFINPTFRAYVI